LTLISYKAYASFVDYTSKNVREILEIAPLQMRKLVLVFTDTEKSEERNTERLTIKTDQQAGTITVAQRIPPTPCK
jgi:hypothetical protein